MKNLSFWTLRQSNSVKFPIRLAIEHQKLVEYRNGKRKHQLKYPNEDKRNYYQKGDLIMTSSAEKQALQNRFPRMKTDKDASFALDFTLLLTGIKTFEDFFINYGYLILKIQAVRNNKTRSFLHLQPVMIVDKDNVVEIGPVEFKSLAQLEIDLTYSPPGLSALKNITIGFMQTMFDGLSSVFGGHLVKVGGRKLIKIAGIKILAEAIKEVILNKDTKEAIREVLIPFLRRHYKKHQRLQRKRTISVGEYAAEMRKHRNSLTKIMAKIILKKIMKKMPLISRGSPLYKKLEYMIYLTVISDTVIRVIADVLVNISTISTDTLAGYIFNAFKKEFVNVWTKELIKL